MFGGLGSFNTLGVSELKPLAAAPLEAARAAPARASTFGEVDDDIDAIDAVDLELFPIFEEEAQELLPKLDGQLRDWLREPATRRTPPPACGRCTRSRAARASPGRCDWARWRTGYSRPSKKAVHKALTDLGHPYAVCRSVDDVKAFFDHIDVRTREAA